jgi:peptide deformylase
MVLEIKKYPDPVLKKVSKKIEKFDESLHQYLQDLNETMVDSGGIGLASIQVGKPLQIFLLNVPEDEEQTPDNLIEVINPEIISSEGEITYQEGCLSIPDYFEDVKRYEKIKVRYQDRYGKEIETEFQDLESIAFQHEFDHLKGKLFVERISYMKRKKFEKEWKKKSR